jgi:DNA-binding SARP family transcriptional activator/tetratricopeptide (TPR) repeat protein
MAIHLITLGGLRVYLDDVEQARLLRRRLRAALLVYVAVERRVPREELMAMFWPESSADNGRHALRQCLYQLRRELGRDWVDAHAQDVVAGDDLQIDVRDFDAALERGDGDAAIRLYRGPFLAGVHLVDLHPWESWVDGRRIRYARAFRGACRARVDGLLAAHDVRGAIEAAQRWVAPDPLDDEAQHRLIAALAGAGERTAAIRQFEAYERLLGAEGLRPLDETETLVEQVRSEAAPGPPHPAHRQPDSRGNATGEATAARNPPATERPPRPRRGLAAVASAVVVLVLLVAAIVYRARVDPPPASPTDIAVLPFSVRGDADAAYLAEGMVSLLATALDGPAVRSVDARAVFGMVAQESGPVPGIEGGRRLAVRLGAGLFVLGDVIQVGDALRIEAAAYRAGGDNAPVTSAVATGVADRVFTLVDSLAVQLLAGLGAADGDRLAHTAAVTTSSLEAFKAYLQGEADFRAGRFERSEERYLRAVEHDSTFAVAHYGLALARDWAARPHAVAAARTAARHADRLTSRDRALLLALQAYMAGDAREAERRYRAILARYPDDLDARMQLAEVLFHYGRPNGQPVAEAEDAWRRVLTYEPRNPAAVVHLARLAAADGRAALLDSLLGPFDSAEPMADRRLAQVAAFRALAHGDTTELRSLVAHARGWEDAAAWQFAAYLTAFSDSPGLTRRVVQDLVDPRRVPGMRADLHWATALLHMENGQLTAAREARMAALAAQADAPDARDRRTFELVTEWWMATLPLPWPDSALVRMRRAASTSALPGSSGQGELPPDDEGDPLWNTLLQLALRDTGRLAAVRLYTVGVLSLRLGETATAAAAADSLDALAQSRPDDWFVNATDAELRARLAWRADRAADALRILDGIEPGSVPLGVVNVVPFFALAHMRHLRGELLVAVGREAEAVEWLGGLGKLSVPEAPFRAVAQLRLARIHDALGNQTRAADHYARFVELWQAGDAVTRSLVEDARRRLSELGPVNEAQGSM